MADQELAGAVKRALVSNPKRDRISTAVRAENPFPTQIGTGQKAKERLSGDEPMRRGLHHQRLSLNPDLNTINTKICRQCGADRRATSARSSWRRQAARRGSYGSPSTCGMAKIRPLRGGWMGRECGQSLSSERCVRARW
jgi:hypothetical protein